MRRAITDDQRACGVVPLLLFRCAAVCALPMRTQLPPNTLTSHLSVEALQVLVPDGHKHVSAVEPQLVGALAAPQNLCKWCQVRIGEQRASSSKYMQRLTVRWPAAATRSQHRPASLAALLRCTCAQVPALQ